MISGVAFATKMKRPKGKTRVIGVQPEGSPSMYESFVKKELSTISESKSIADGLLVRKPGDITFEFVRRYVDKIVLVSDAEILDATKQLITKEHVLAEPSGAAAFAGLLKSRREDRNEKTVKSAAIVSGGNISLELLHKLLESKSG